MQQTKGQSTQFTFTHPDVTYYYRTRTSRVIMTVLFFAAVISTMIYFHGRNELVAIFLAGASLPATTGVWMLLRRKHLRMFRDINFSFRKKFTKRTGLVVPPNFHITNKNANAFQSSYRKEGIAHSDPAPSWNVSRSENRFDLTRKTSS